MEIWDTEIPDKNRTWERQRDFLEWRGQVLAIRDMSEHRLRQLYKRNYSPADIEANKHWAEFPPQGMKKRFEPGMAIGEKRGRTLDEKGLLRFYAQALLDKAQWVLAYRRLEPDMLQRVRAEIVQFKAMVESYKAKD